jgi:membrane associated rhomboid family serine protease
MPSPREGRVNEPQIAWIEVARAPTREGAAELALVLEAVGLSCGTARTGDDHVLIVRAEEAARARAELAKYTSENRGWPPRASVPPPISRGFEAATVYAILLVLAFLTERREAFGLDWWTAGCADAGLIRHGAWWRSLTALALHADALHLAGNVVFGALFGVMLAQSVGSGVAWLAFVVAGGIGNWLNAWVQSPAHVSVGASTAVFGLLGVQVAHDWMRRKHLHYSPWRRAAPLVIGAALLAWLGGGAKHVDPSNLARRLDDLDVAIHKVDVGAHVLGFAVGIALGAILGRFRRAIPSGPRAQAAIAGAAIAAMAIAWIVAIRSGAGG